jgi:hypothetical protein
VGAAIVEAQDGRIFAATDPHCHLSSFAPRTEEMADYGSLDEEEQCPGSIVFDSFGWAYVGIGTARQNIVAFHPDTGARAQIARDDDRVVGGTSIEAPGGGHQQGKEAALYVIDWRTRNKLLDAVPVPGAQDIVCLDVGSDDLVHGLTSNSVLFVYDVSGRETILNMDLSEYGPTLRQSLVRGMDGLLYGALPHAIVRIEPESGTHRKVADAPGFITVGGIVHGERLYFACATHPWSYRLSQEA